jgi:hypothetical protein
MWEKLMFGFERSDRDQVILLYSPLMNFYQQTHVGRSSKEGEVEEATTTTATMRFTTPLDWNLRRSSPENSLADSGL